MVFDSTIQIQHVPSRREMPDYLDSLGFKADYVPCVNKVAIDWKVNVENGQIDTHFMPSGASYAVVPSYGMLVLDCDRAKDGAESGMAIIGGLLRQAFSNDEDFFAARTFRVRTPSGGVHLYYRIPEWMRGHIKGSARSLAHFRFCRSACVFSSLCSWCRRAGTCPGNAGWTSRWTSRSESVR